MEAEDLLESVVYALPWFAVAGIFYAIVLWKKHKGTKLHGQARELLAEGNEQDARDTLLQALWNANEEPTLEKRILADLRTLYERAGTELRTDDYELLIRQFEQLSKKGSHKAWAELKEVQALKKELIDGMPQIA